MSVFVSFDTLSKSVRTAKSCISSDIIIFDAEIWRKSPSWTRIKTKCRGQGWA